MVSAVKNSISERGNQGQHQNQERLLDSEHADGENMTYKEVAEYAGGNLSEIVGTYIWEPVSKSGESYNVSIKIEIHRKNDQYYPIPSHRVKTPRQATPYVSIDTKDTPEEALFGCISGFKMFMGTTEETAWPLFKI